MRKWVVSVAVLLGFSGLSGAIDWELAKKYDQMFSQFTQEALAKSPCRMSVKKLLDMIKKGEEVVLIDIRTPAEASVVGLTFKNSMHIPMNEIFKEENLKKIPTDKPVVLVCHSGARALATTVALRSIGFNNVYALKGGIVKLANYLTPKTTKGLK